MLETSQRSFQAFACHHSHFLRNKQASAKTHLSETPFSQHFEEGKVGSFHRFFPRLATRRCSGRYRRPRTQRPVT